jgi:hypothetical protein
MGTDAPVGGDFGEDLSEEERCCYLLLFRRNLRENESGVKLI